MYNTNAFPPTGPTCLRCGLIIPLCTCIHAPMLQAQVAKNMGAPAEKKEEKENCHV
jgi:hypothetical protein